MGIVSRGLPDVTALASGSLPAPQIEADPDLGSVIGAAFRQENIVGSAITRHQSFRGVYNDVDRGYSAWDDIKGTPYEEHWQEFAQSNNHRFTDALKKQIDTETQDRATIAAAGWEGTFASIGAGIVDPSVLVPVGGQIAKAKGVYKIVRAALAGGAGTAIQEAGLQATQNERPLEESAISVGGGFVLGGLLGGASVLLTKGEREAALNAYDRLLPDEDDVIYGRDESGGPNVDLGGGGTAAQPDGGTGGLSAAPVAPPIGNEALTVAGRAANTAADITKSLSPNLRLNFSPNQVARQVGQELSEGTLYQVGHADGITTGASVSRLAGMTERARMSTGMQQLNDIFKEMKQSGFNMSFDEFDTSVGRAMRTGDVGDNDFISRGAKALRESVVNPFFNDGKAVGLYDEADDVSFAPSYFPRQYKTKVLVANEPAIKSEWSTYMEGRIAADYADSAAALRAKHAEFDSHAADLALTPEDRAAKLKTLEGEGATLDAANPDHVDRITQVNDLRRKAGEAAALGDHATETRLRDQARKLYSEGDAEFKDYIKSRRSLRGKRNRVSETDAAKVEARAKSIEAQRSKVLRQFYDRWEVRNMGEGVDPFDPAVKPNFGEIARGVVDDVYGKLTGRDFGSSASVAPEYMTPIKRGPVKERTLPIPDEMLARQGVLEDAASHVLHRYARVISADVELTKKFGDPSMTEPLKKIGDEYAALRNGVTDPKQLTDLHAREQADTRDIMALRDLVRGTYRAAENAGTFGRLVRAAGHLNFVRSLGGVVVSSLSDIYRPAMVHGLGTFLGEGVAPLLKNLDAVKLATKEAQLAGLVTDRVLEQRISAYSGIADPMERGVPIERLLQNMSSFGAKWSGINIWTDGMKAITSVMSQNRILDGTADQRTLAFLGIDKSMAKKIRAEFDVHGEVMDGVHVANTEKWADLDAVRAFQAAVGKDVDSIIVTPGVGDVPLFAHTPLGRVLLQFRSFMFAAHQRVLLRGLQEDKARFLSGMVGMTALGMLSVYLKAWRGGQDRLDKFKAAAENPGYLIGEGLDNSGVFTLGFDFANTTEKLTQAAKFSFNPIKTPMMAAGAAVRPGASQQGESIRFSSRSPLGTLLGPTAGMAENAFTAAGGAVHVAQGKDLSKSERNAAIGLLPYNSFYGFKEATQAMTGDSPYNSED